MQRAETFRAFSSGRNVPIRRPLKRVAALVSLALTLAACTTPERRAESPIPPPPAPAPDVPSSRNTPPPDIDSIPDAVPRPVVRSRSGNPPFYDVFGKRYFVLASAEGFTERGVASWYGPGFHKESTATGEPYDMYAMTAAHKTLPLPCYAQITNLRNGRTVIVYINDRGPFKDGRIVDLSYTAAARLDMLKAGTALVELKVVSAAPRATTAEVAPLFVQAGAFGDVSNAQRLASQLRGAGYNEVSVRTEQRDGRTLHRVHVGPVRDAREFDRVVAHLKSLGVTDARLAGQ